MDELMFIIRVHLTHNLNTVYTIFTTALAFCEFLQLYMLNNQQV
jgi:hypothetical protein